MLAKFTPSSRRSTNLVLRKKSLGQGMVEYIIIVALIAVAAIGVFRLFGDTARNQVAGMAQELAGQSGDKQAEAAGKKADDAAKAGVVERNLKNYTGNN